MTDDSCRSEGRVLVDFAGKQIGLQQPYWVNSPNYGRGQGLGEYTRTQERPGCWPGRSGVGGIRPFQAMRQ